MATDLTLRAAGLYTDPNPHTEAPQGALRVADNIVIRRAGIAEPRPGFRTEAIAYDTGLTSLNRIVGIYGAPTADTSEWYGQTTEVVIDDTGTAVSLAGDVTGDIGQDGEYAGASSAKVDGNLYVPANAVGVVGVVADSAARAAGLPRPQTPRLFSLPVNGVTWLADTELVAYRVVFEREIGDVLYVSPPSGRVVVENNSGASAAVQLELDFADAPSVQAGWTLKVYRSETVAAGVTPSDELALAVEHTITTANVTNGFVYVTDSTPSTSRGESLYTNATQLGALQENGRPPNAHVLEAFNEMMFFGDVTERPRMVVTFLREPSLITRIVNQTTTTSGNSDINFAGTLATTDYTAYFARYRDLYVMREDAVDGPHYADVAGGEIPALTYFLGTGSGAGTGGTIDISAATTGTDTGVVPTTGVFWLALVPNATDFPAVSVPYYWYRASSDPGESLANGEIVPGTTPGADLADWAASIAKTAGITALVVDENVIVLERDTNSAGIGLSDRFTLQVPTGQLGSLDISGATAGTAVAQGAAPGYTPFVASERRFPNRVYYSRKQEPEHVPPVNFVDLGASSEPIVAMKATRRALFVFKTDGIWTITGDTPETLRVEQIDSTARLLHPKAVAVGGDRVFAWTDAGVVMLSEGGVAANLSAPAIEPDLRAIQVALQATSDPASGGTLGCFLSYQDGEERLLLGVPAAVGDDYAASVYQYDMRTQGWTCWTSGDREYSAATTIAGRILFAGLDADDLGDVWRETLDSDEAPHADVTTTIDPSFALPIGDLISLAVANVGTVVAGSWAHQAGTGARGVVTGVSSGESSFITVAPLDDTTWDGSVVTFYLPVQQCIEWIAKTAQVPTVTKHWQRGVLTYESDRRMYDATLSFRSDMIHTPASVTTEHTLQDDALPEDIPFLTTRDHARAAILFPKLCISQGGARWALSALHLDYELGSSRSGRRAR